MLCNYRIGRIIIIYLAHVIYRSDWIVPSFGKLQFIVLLSYTLMLLLFHFFVYPVHKLPHYKHNLFEAGTTGS